jgi:hypothetical protein
VRRGDGVLFGATATHPDMVRGLPTASSRPRFRPGSRPMATTIHELSQAQPPHVPPTPIHRHTTFYGIAKHALWLNTVVIAAGQLAMCSLTHFHVGRGSQPPTTKRSNSKLGSLRHVSRRHACETCHIHMLFFFFLSLSFYLFPPSSLRKHSGRAWRDAQYIVDTLSWGFLRQLAAKIPNRIKYLLEAPIKACF